MANAPVPCRGLNGAAERLPREWTHEPREWTHEPRGAGRLPRGAGRLPREWTHEPRGAGRMSHVERDACHVSGRMSQDA